MCLCMYVPVYVCCTICIHIYVPVYVRMYICCTIVSPLAQISIYGISRMHTTAYPIHTHTLLYTCICVYICAHTHATAMSSKV